MKIRIKCWIYFNPLAVVGDGREDAYFILPGGCQEKTESRVPVICHSIEVELGKFDPRPAIIEAAARKRDDVAAQAEKETARLDKWIKSMLAVDDAHPG